MTRARSLRRRLAASKIIRDLVKDPGVVVTRGSTYENRANVATTYLSKLIKRFEGTRFGRQELYAEILEDVPGALWSQARIDETRAPVLDERGRRIVRNFCRIVVAIDPAMTNTEVSDETGIIVAALGRDGDAYLLHDASGRYAPDEWAGRLSRCITHYRADVVVAENNNGGDLVEQTLRAVEFDSQLSQRHARPGKFVRAEPISALYMRPSENPAGSLIGHVHHVGILKSSKSR